MDKLEKPGTSKQPATSEEPAKPDEPAKPEEPAKSSESEELDDDCRKGNPSCEEGTPVWGRPPIHEVNSEYKNFVISLMFCRANLHKLYDNGAAERWGYDLMQRINGMDPKFIEDWVRPYPEYDPPEYTLPVILNQTVPWADPDVHNPDFHPVWNGYDEGSKIDRRSYTRSYRITLDRYPLNVAGRTGIRGRGRLGRWGPNHAVDPIVTRWKQVQRPFGPAPVLQHDTGTAQLERGTLQVIVIQRRDNLEWALPGGMMDPGETINDTAMREFMEEALDSNNMSEEEVKETKAKLKRLFERGHTVYKGYVDDPRNTDNAWMETHALLCHDPDTSNVLELGGLTLKAGSDALDVKWMDVNDDIKLYANHKDLLFRGATHLMASTWD